jgi:hypothetical protein
MCKPVLLFLSLTFGLFLVGLSLQPPPPIPPDREPALEAPRLPGSPLTEGEYKRLKVALSSFDLAAGLTRRDFETMPAGRGYAFYSLMGIFWLVLGLKTLGKPKKPWD